MEVDFSKPILTVDIVALSVLDHRLHVLLLKRVNPPSAGRFTLPGGFVHVDTDIDATDAATRVLQDKAGVSLRYLEQLYTFASATRDKRGWSASIAYLALVQHDATSALAATTRWVPVDACPSLPFDHGDILQMALRRVRDKASYSSLPAFLLPEVFTLPQLQRVYEEVLGMNLNTPAFRRKILDQMLIEPVESTPATGQRGRPAQSYRLRQEALQDMGRVVMLPDVRRGG